MRDCQPSPVLRKNATTSGDSRMVVGTLVGVFCGPNAQCFLQRRRQHLNGRTEPGQILHRQFADLAVRINEGFALAHMP